jgi:hypothetical protein
MWSREEEKRRDKKHNEMYTDSERGNAGLLVTRLFLFRVFIVGGFWISMGGRCVDRRAMRESEK